jgi:riboflavin kinase
MNGVKVVSIGGKVVRGNQIGQTIGFPTANIFMHDKELQLKQGVYGVKVVYQSHLYYGVMNVGTRPTFEEKDKSVSYEVHIFEFERCIYGETLEVEPCFFVRPEKAFSNVKELIQQIKQDAAYVKKRFRLL